MRRIPSKDRRREHGLRSVLEIYRQERATCWKNALPNVASEFLVMINRVPRRGLRIIIHSGRRKFAFCRRICAIWCLYVRRFGMYICRKQPINVMGLPPDFGINPKLRNVSMRQVHNVSHKNVVVGLSKRTSKPFELRECSEMKYPEC